MCCNKYRIFNQWRCTSDINSWWYTSFMEFSSKKSTSSTKFKISKRTVSCVFALYILHLHKKFQLFHTLNQICIEQWHYNVTKHDQPHVLYFNRLILNEIWLFQQPMHTSFYNFNISSRINWKIICNILLWLLIKWSYLKLFVSILSKCRVYVYSITYFRYIGCENQTSSVFSKTASSFT